MLFGMVERGMEADVVGDKGKGKKITVNGPTNDGTRQASEEALWAVVLTKELWKKGIW